MGGTSIRSLSYCGMDEPVFNDTSAVPRVGSLSLVSRRRRRWPFVLGALAIAVLVLVLVWDWNWLRPIVAQQASAALGRTVTLGHFTLHPGRQTVVVADDIQIENLPGTGSDPPFLRVERLTITIDAMEFLRNRRIVLPDILLERPDFVATQAEDGTANYLFPALSGQGSGTPAKIGNLRITGGQAHVLLLPTHADFRITVDTRETGSQPQIVAEAQGTYAAQKITGAFVGGALLSLRDSATPYPVDLKLQNGDTKLSLAGTVQSPLNLGGADLKLELAGTNMEDLLPLIGIAFPKTPSFQIKGDVDYAGGKIRFRDFSGKVGSSDVAGNIEVDPAGKRPTVTADITSRQVDLEDLAGAVGSEPGRVGTPNQTPAQRQAVLKAEANSRLLPTTTISLPKLLAADVHLKYRGAKILGRHTPFDSLAADLDIVDGRIFFHPISLGIGQGRIAANADLQPLEGGQFQTKADISVQRVELGRLLKAGDFGDGTGLIGGHAELTTTGNSVATLLGQGNGSVQLTMAGGGEISALLIDLSGLQFGNSLLSALGIPRRDKIECFVADFALQRGVLKTRSLLLDTQSDIITGSGTIDLARENVDYIIKTDSKHLSIGSLPAPIAITGPFKGTGVLPDIATLGARAGVAVGLGIIFPPAALLPTIQLGVGDDHRCAALMKRK